MSHPQPPIREPTAKETDRYTTTMHNVAIGMLILGPAIAALPPRKLNTSTVTLAGMTAFSADYLYRERYGRSVWQRAAAASSEGQTGITLPTDKAREFQKQFKEAQAQGTEVAKQQTQNIVDKVWMGGETEGWKERREKEVLEKLKEGKGYGDIIMDQIWDVWTWGKGEKNEEEEK